MTCKQQLYEQRIQLLKQIFKKLKLAHTKINQSRIRTSSRCSVARYEIDDFEIEKSECEYNIQAKKKQKKPVTNINGSASIEMVLNL